MSSKLGSKLAQLASAKKKSEESVQITEEERKEIEAAATASNVNAVQSILLPHVNEFNDLADASLRIALEVASPRIMIRRSRLSLLTLEITAKAAVVKRKSGAYTSDDYFTICRVPDGAMTFSNYSAEVEKPLDSNQFAELVLMEALGLDQ